MRIFIDIDGTIAFCDGPAVCRLCNDRWSLGISEERMEQVKWIADFQAMPEVQARCEERGQEQFDYELGWMKFRPEALLTDIVATGSQEAISKLAQIGTITYCTARYSDSSPQAAPRENCEAAIRSIFAYCNGTGYDILVPARQG